MLVDIELLDVIKRLVKENPSKVTVGVLGEIMDTSNNYKILVVRQKLLKLGIINRDKTFNREKAIEVLKRFGELGLP